MSLRLIQRIEDGMYLFIYKSRSCPAIRHPSDWVT